MAEPVSVRCPHCKVVLKVKNSSAIGKKVTCPKCHEPFVAKAVSAGSRQPVKAEAKPKRKESPEAPLPKTGAAKKGKKPAKSKNADSRKRMMLIGGGVVGVAALGGLVFFLMGMFSGSEPVAQPKMESPPPAKEAAPEPAPVSSGINLAYLPGDSELFVAVRVGELVKSPLIQPFLQSPEAQQPIQQFTEKLGIGISDIETVTFGVAGVSEQATKAKQGPLGVMQPPDLSKQRLSVVLRTSKPIDLKRVTAVIAEQQSTASELQAQTHAETAYYLIPDPKGDNGAVFASDETTLVVCPEAMVKEMIDSGGKPLSQADLSFVDAKQHVVMAVVPTDPSALESAAGQLPGDSASSESAAASKLAAVAKDKVRAGSLGITLTDGVALQLTGSCVDTESAGSVQGALDELLTEGRSKLAESRDGAPEQFGALFDLGELVLNGTKTSADGSSVRLAAAIPGSSVGTLAQLPGMLMSMMMMQSLSGVGEMTGVPPDGAMFSQASPAEQAPPAASVTEDGLQKNLYFIEKKPFEVGLFPPSNLEEPPLIVGFEVVGEPAASATAYGHLQIPAAQDDQGKSLRLVSPPIPQNDPTDRFVPLQRGMMYPGTFGPPEDKIRIFFMLERPTGSAKQLSVLEGTVQLMGGGEQRTVTIPDVLQKAGKAFESPDLEAVGLTVTPEAAAEDEKKSLSVTVAGEPLNLADIVPVDATGEELHVTQKTVMRNGDSTKYTIQAEQDLPADVGLRLTILADQTIATVPFKFESVPLPPLGPTQ